MNNIPKKLRDSMGAEDYYKVCAVTGDRGTRTDPIQWHHNYIWAGKQLQKRFAIIPIKESIHDLARTKKVKEKLDWIMLNRATDAEILMISKTFDYFRYRAQLNKKYGIYMEPQSTSTGINYPWMQNNHSIV